MHVEGGSSVCEDASNNYGCDAFFFWWGIGGCHGLGELENAINPCMSKYVGVCESTD